MKQVWILGAGKFGQQAARVLHKKHPAAKLIIVDKKKAALRWAETPDIQTVHSDGISFLLRNLKCSAVPDWIIPAIPLHVAYAWIKAKLANRYRIQEIPIPDDLAATLPFAVKGDHLEVYASYADFICPSDCPGPDTTCKHTGDPRPVMLHNLLLSVKYKNYFPVVVQSHQLFAGGGGYTPEGLFSALEAVKTAENPVLLSTACRCHGVLHAFKLYGADAS